MKKYAITTSLSSIFEGSNFKINSYSEYNDKKYFGGSIKFLADLYYKDMIDLNG